MVGTTILDRYQLFDLLGFGGMGAVFKGVHIAMDRPVAIKILPKLDPLTAARFHREAKLVSKLSHPNTITVYDFGQTKQGFLYLVMEYLEGRTLGRVLKDDGALHPRRAVQITHHICRSLAEAHEVGIVHRDIKPDNIFLIHRNDDPDFVKVLDFGIAKVMAGEDPEEDLTQQGRIVGTPRYMAPEQVLGLPVDHRADVYSLGCILYQMLTGSPPFDDSSTAMLMMKHAHEQPSGFMYHINKNQTDSMPPGLEAVVMKALNKRPEARQQTIDMLRTELELVMPATSSLYAAPDASNPRLSGAFSVPQHSAYDNNTPGTPSGAFAIGKDPTNPSGSNPSLSHPALRPHNSGDWPVTVNQPPPMAHIPQHPSGPYTPPPPLTPTPGDHSGENEWPGQQNRRRNMLLIGLGLLAMLLLVIGAATAGFFFGNTPGPGLEAKGNANVATPAPPAKEGAQITIRSNPSGAAIFHNDRPIGETPMVIEVPSEEDTVKYSVRLDGYEPVTRTYTVATLDKDGAEWDIAMVVSEPPTSDPIADKGAGTEAKGEADPETVEPKAPKRNNATARNNRNNRRNNARNNPKPDDKGDAVADKGPAVDNPIVEESPKDPPAADKGADTPVVKDDTPKKPKVNALDDGGAKKPKVNALDDGGGAKKPKVNALDGGPKVKPLQ